MDSLTQIVLGAACGEVVAGKKLGNRAMLWGGIGGTIPDLDVFASFFTDEITATAFHRGFMHSFLFAALAPWVFAWLTQRFYERSIYRRPGYKLIAMSLWIFFYLAAAAGINFIPVLLGEGLSWYIFGPTLVLGVWLVTRLWRDYWQADLALVEVPFRTWVSVFFWSIFTHPILDCFTGWGTQIWQPFSDLRVQWNTVSVVDPIATLPFGICLIVASRIYREKPSRRFWNWLGIGWFCFYILGYSCWHKWKVTRIFEREFQARGIQYQRLMNGPVIFNNIVWNCVAEGDTAFYQGLFGYNDCREEVFRINVLPKNHHLLADVSPEDRDLKFIKWFSDGYYNVVKRPDNTLQINDLRFGLLGDSVRGPESYVFPFVVDEKRDGRLKIHHDRNVEESKRNFGPLWQKIKGVCPPENSNSRKQ